VTAEVDSDRLQLLGMLASALAGRALAVAAGGAGDPSWTDGQTVFVDPSARARTNLESVAVHASMLAADSLSHDVVDRLIRHPKLAKRYLAVEGHRALVANADLLPGVLASLAVTKTAASLLYELKPNDPLTIAGATLLLAVVAIVAGYLPARRASKVNPLVALRDE